MRVSVGFCALLFAAVSPMAAEAACVDAVVLVHGNTGSPSDFDATVSQLLRRGYAASDIRRPRWGSSVCAACNDHSGSEALPVEQALIDAAAASCTGRVDVIGHSMGVTLLAREITRLGMSGYIDSFIGIAGAYRGLRSCGLYPFNVATPTCGEWGLSLGSPLLQGLRDRPLARRVHSIKSWYDEIVCATGICTVGGIHSSAIDGEWSSTTLPLGHFGLARHTSVLQADLLQ
ncbi:lipase family protein [Tahibacter amnicola]|uniref:Lipase family protein n=1 Tax=Tahibacter amnicola TaxID=2976241 RepID=A0ABY6BJ71_9GAMM|nr:lipase family protein [Tahibacter amnicola]UXI70058.1 lipase family protein [Tahibacter amnicola]